MCKDCEVSEAHLGSQLQKTHRQRLRSSGPDPVLQRMEDPGFCQSSESPIRDPEQLAALLPASVSLCVKWAWIPVAASLGRL